MQDFPSFIRLHERAFRSFGGAPRAVRLDDLKAGAARAFLYDPYIKPVYSASAAHSDFCPLPCFPRKAKEKGKVKKAGDCLKGNVLKGKRFDLLSDMIEHPRRRNRNVASSRIHGTTKRQVLAPFLEAERGALQPLPAPSFEHFSYGRRMAHIDGHIQAGNAFYSNPCHLLREQVVVRHTDRILKIFLQGNLWRRIPSQHRGRL